jgi:4-amino-4-deoxy-L-arabinose transferase-like glycosyltransferase
VFHRAPRLIAAIWILFIARGLFYITYLPPWEGFDEWSHFAVIEIAAHGEPIPDPAHRVSREIQASLDLVPWVDGTLNQDRYWSLSESARSKLQDRIRKLPPEWSRETAQDGAKAYEAQQTPLYYWLASVLDRALSSASLLTRVWSLRLFSLFLASAIIPLGFFVARKLFNDDAQALGVVLLITVTPELMLAADRIGNDSLAVAAGSLLLAALFRSKENPSSIPCALMLGGALGIALLTKAYFLTLVPPIVVFAVILARRNKAYGPLPCILGCAAMIAGWWYLRTFHLTHSISGEQVEVAGRGSAMPFLTAVSKMSWLRALDFAALSHIWIGNWSLLVVRAWMYRVFECIALLAIAGLARQFIRPRKELPRRGDLALLMACYGALVAGLAYHTIQTFQVWNTGQTFGHYLVPLLAAESILIVCGLKAILPRPCWPGIVPAGAVLLIALDLFGTVFYAMPYYTGLTAHTAIGGLPALKIDALKSGALNLMLARLAWNKPDFIGEWQIWLLWIVFLLASVSLIALAFWISRRRAFYMAIGNISGTTEWSDR